MRISTSSTGSSSTTPHDPAASRSANAPAVWNAASEESTLCALPSTSVALRSTPQGGLADEQAGERRVAVEFAVRQEPELLELVAVEQMGLVQDDRGVTATFVFLGGEQVHRLRDQRCLVEARDAAEGGDDAAVEATAADGRVAEVDHRVP